MLKGDIREGPVGPGFPAPPAPVVPAPAPVTTQAPVPSMAAAIRAAQSGVPAQPAAPAPQAPQNPAPGPEPPEIPGGGGGGPKPQQQAQKTEQLAPDARPGSRAATQSLAARAGVRIGAFDPRFRNDEQTNSVLAALGVNPTSISAAQTPVPPSVGFNPKQFEAEQMILGALRGK